MAGAPAEASPAAGMFTVLPSTTWLSGDSPLAAASVAGSIPFAAAIDHRLSPSTTVWGTAAPAVGAETSASVIPAASVHRGTNGMHIS